MKKICIITSSKDLQELISNTLFDGSAPVRSNGGLLGFWGNCQVLVVMTRSGKVNVAVTVSEVVNDIMPDAVIITGTASSLSSTLLPGSIIVGSHFCYYDVCFGIDRDFGRYPDEPPYYHSDDRIVSAMIDAGLTVHQGIVLSGDSLVDSRPAARKILNHFGKARALDMESPPAAHVCNRNAVPFVSIRVIDSVPVMDDKAKVMYPQFKFTNEDLHERLFAVLNKTMESL